MLDLHSMSADPNPRTILRIEEVLHRTGLKRTMLYDLIGKELFPQQISLGARAVGWYREEVEEWIGSRDSGKREPRRSDQVVTDGKAMTLAPEEPNRGVEKTTTLRSGVLKHPKDRARTSSTFQKAAATKAASAPTLKATGDKAVAINEAEELQLLRDENARLKRLVGDLVLKNDQLLSACKSSGATS